MVHVRVDENVKAQAAETLASMGLTVSDAIRVFLTRVVADKELPFALKAPNAPAARHRRGRRDHRAIALALPPLMNSSMTSKKQPQVSGQPSARRITPSPSSRTGSVFHTPAGST
jgi:addiction module RelB/DinJ family antitoxin